jgi:hypothetical protein
MIIAVIKPTMTDLAVNSGDFEAVLATVMGLSRSVRQIHMMKAEHVFEKSPIGFGIFAVNNYMGAINHRRRRPPMLRFYWES